MGKVYIFLGSPGGPSAAPDRIMEDPDHFGSGFGAGLGWPGDVLGTGQPLITVSAPFHLGGEPDEGRVYLFCTSP